MLRTLLDGFGLSKIGHSVRTIKDIDKITKSDLKEFTSYLSNRVIYCHRNNINDLNQNLKKISLIGIKLNFQCKEIRATEKISIF